MKKWLNDLFISGNLLLEEEEYLLSRGAKRERIKSLGIISWDSLAVGKSPDPIFNERYFSRKFPNRLKGCICTPYRSLTDQIIGFEARAVDHKWITDFRVSPESHWCSFWLGLNKESMEKLWAGGEVWIVEGLFDMFALDWVIPESDLILAIVQARLTTPHLEFLRRFAKKANLSLDMDPPGRKGAYKAARNLRELGVSNRVVEYGPGKDPGEIWDRGGVRELKEVFFGDTQR